jgi:hypothetical protein
MNHQAGKVYIKGRGFDQLVPRRYILPKLWIACQKDLGINH